MRLVINNEFDVQLASLALIFLELKIEDFGGAGGNGLNLGEIWPLWEYYLDRLSKTNWATQFTNKYPIEGTTIGIVIEAWKAYAAIRIAEQAAAAARLK